MSARPVAPGQGEGETERARQNANVLGRFNREGDTQGLHTPQIWSVVPQVIDTGVFLLHNAMVYLILVFYLPKTGF